MSTPAKGAGAKKPPARKTPAKKPAAKAPAKDKPAMAASPAAAPKPAVPDTTTAWSVPLPPNSLQGFGFGATYPTVIFHCVTPATSPAERAELLQRFEALFEGAKGVAQLDPFVDPAEGSQVQDTAVWFAALADRLQRMADLPVYMTARPLMPTRNGMSYLVPVLSRGIKPTSDLLVLACRAFAAARKPERDKLRPEAQTAFGQLLASALTTSNTPRLVKAAIENGITFQELPGSMVLYGVGRKSVMMDSTFTPFCSNIGARLAKFKQQSTSLLRRAGLPAPNNGIAVDEAQALEFARQLGYPVVVKPADKDGGVAVQADLRTEDEVRQAFAAAAKVSKNVLVEEFIPGRDFRITVFRGKALWAVERVPAGVTGDGTSTIRQLVDAANADPRRGSTVYAALKKIKLDAEAAALLARNDMAVDTVPKAGEFVRLRRSSNVSSGGMPVVVTEKMHPDNARLAERAATVVGLDLAGIDLIIPDIAVSWRESRSGICEVNAQPELGGVTAGHLYPLVLKSLVRGNGHIPTIAVFGGAEADAVVARLAEGLTAQGVTVGVHDRGGVRVGAETILDGELHPLRAGRMLTMDRRVEAIVLGVLDARLLQQGLPLDRIDALFLTGEAPPTPDVVKNRTDGMLPEVLRLLLPHCRRVAALVPADEFDPTLQAALKPIGPIGHVVPKDQRETFLKGIVSQVAAAAREPAAGTGQGGRRPAA